MLRFDDARTVTTLGGCLVELTDDALEGTRASRN